MSHHVASLVLSRKLGMDSAAKSILILMATYASDDGSGVWASKKRLASELEVSIRHVRRAIGRMVDAGIMAPIGTRRTIVTNATGGNQSIATVEYRLNIAAIKALPAVSDESTSSMPPGHHVRPDVMSARTPCPPEAQDVDPPDTNYSPDTMSARTQRPLHPDTMSAKPKLRTLEDSTHSARASEDGQTLPLDADQLFDEVLHIAGHDKGAPIPALWMPPAAPRHVWRWHEQLGLPIDDILTAARQARARFPNPPTSPRAWDYLMEITARERARPPMQAVQARPPASPTIPRTIAKPPGDDDT